MAVFFLIYRCTCFNFTSNQLLLRFCVLLWSFFFLFSFLLALLLVYTILRSALNIHVNQYWIIKTFVVRDSAAVFLVLLGSRFTWFHFGLFYLSPVFTAASIIALSEIDGKRNNIGFCLMGVTLFMVRLAQRDVLFSLPFFVQWLSRLSMLD